MGKLGVMMWNGFNWLWTRWIGGIL